MFACSEGGHFSQMMALKQLFGAYPSVFVTDNVRADKSLPGLENVNDVYHVNGIAEARKKNAGNKHNDSRWTYLSGYVALFRQCYKVMMAVRPQVVISTGSNIAVPLFYVGKLMGCKLVFIETRAHVYTKSLTGKLIGGICDKVIVPGGVPGPPAGPHGCLRPGDPLQHVPGPAEGLCAEHQRKRPGAHQGAAQPPGERAGGL